MNEQPEALRLADELEGIDRLVESPWHALNKAAAELRRLHEVNQELVGKVNRLEAQIDIAIEAKLKELNNG